LKVPFSQTLRADVIQDVLENAGPWGRAVIDGVDWSTLDYEEIDIPDVEVGGDFTSHVVPHVAGPGTFPTPSRADALVDWIVASRLSFAGADFAMPDGNPRIDASLRRSVDGVMFYAANRGADGIRDTLSKVVAAATSWTFLGVLLDRDDVAPVDLGAQAICARVHGFVFGIHSGDTYLMAIAGTK
jgi:hypothetical protein